MKPEAPAPNHGFEDSRRLTGPNRWFAGSAVILTPLGAAAADPHVLACWAARVAAMVAALGWPGAAPQSHRHASGTLLALAAPADQLFTATEVNEWAWERCAAEAGETGFDIAHAFDGDAAVEVFRHRAGAELRPALVALQAEAATRGLPVLVDDDEVSIGAGHGSRVWPQADLPAVVGVPWADLCDVPTALVTGSNGKTTTVRLLSAMCAVAGVKAGHCCTEGVFVDGRSVAGGDYSGPAGARAVLRHAGVRMALLETARGGLLRRGLAVARADVAVVTNISPDHLGEYGIDSAHDLAEVKLVVARAVTPEAGRAGRAGLLVLNADDAVLMAAAARLPHAVAAPKALFSHEHDHPALVAGRRAGGSTCGVRGGRLLLSDEGIEHDLGAVVDMPLTLGGAARHNVENVAAAALAAAGLRLPVPAIRHALRHFGSAPQDNPGRLERWAHRGATVLIDYAHNPEGLAQLLQVARSPALAAEGGRLCLLLGQAGNRDDAAITELARVAAASQPDLVVIKELPDMLRGRQPGEVPALLERALLAAGLPPARCRQVADEEAAARTLLEWAGPGDVVVLPVHTTAVRGRLVSWLSATAGR